MAVPFGLRFGSQPPEGFVSVETFVAVSSVPPSPHPDFVNYIVAFSERTGIAKIIANSAPFVGDEYGDATRSLFEKLKSQLAAKYGEPELFDFLKFDSIWSDRRDWATAIRNRERFLSASLKRESVNLPNELEAIDLDTFDSGDGCQVSLTYSGANWAALRSEIDAAEADVL